MSRSTVKVLQHRRLGMSTFLNLQRRQRETLMTSLQSSGNETRFFLSSTTFNINTTSVLVLGMSFTLVRMSLEWKTWRNGKARKWYSHAWCVTRASKAKGTSNRIPGFADFPRPALWGLVMMESTNVAVVMWHFQTGISLTCTCSGVIRTRRSMPSITRVWRSSSASPTWHESEHWLLLRSSSVTGMTTLVVFSQWLNRWASLPSSTTALMMLRTTRSTCYWELPGTRKKEKLSSIWQKRRARRSSFSTINNGDMISMIEK